MARETELRETVAQDRIVKILYKLESARARVRVMRAVTDIMEEAHEKENFSLRPGVQD